MKQVSQDFPVQFSLNWILLRLNHRKQTANPHHGINQGHEKPAGELDARLGQLLHIEACVGQQ